MSIEIHETEHPQGLLVKLQGEAGLAQIDTLSNHFMKIMARHPAKVVLDISQLGFIASAGMGALVSLERGLRRRGGKVYLAAPQPEVREAFYRARLQDIFTIVATVEAALSEGSAS
jgi:anti-sigma B factor antagonist